VPSAEREQRGAHAQDKFAEPRVWRRRTADCRRRVPEEQRHGQKQRDGCQLSRRHARLQPAALACAEIIDE